MYPFIMAAVMRGLDAEAYDRKYDDKELVRRILHYFRPHRRKILVVTVAIFLLALASAALPLIITNGIDLITTQGDDRLMPLLASLGFSIPTRTLLTCFWRTELILG